MVSVRSGICGTNRICWKACLMATGFGLISKTIWHSKRFRSLKDPLAKLVYHYLHTNDHRNSAGCYELRRGYASYDLDISLEDYDRAMHSAIDSGLVAYDAEREIVLIYGFFRFNPITNSKHEAGARKCIMRLPDCEIKRLALDLLKAHIDKKQEKTITCEEDSGLDSGNDSPIDSPIDTGMRTTGTREHGKGIRESKDSLCAKSRFDEFWDAFADKRGRTPAEKVWKKMKPDDALADKIIAGASAYATLRKTFRPDQVPKMAQGWLLDRRWEDEGLIPAQSKPIDLGDTEYWRAMLGDPASKFRKSHHRDNWNEQLHGPSPWRKRNGKIPPEIYAQYGPAWGWIGKTP